MKPWLPRPGFSHGRIIARVDSLSKEALEPFFDGCPGIAVSLPTSVNDRLSEVVGLGRRRSGFKPKWKSRIVTRSNECVERSEVCELPGHEGLPEIGLESTRVFAAQCEANRRADVAKNRALKTGSQLVEELVGKHESETVFSRLGKNRGQGVRQEVLRLIDEEDKVASLSYGKV